MAVGYWNKPEETACALPGGALHTGDVGCMDAGGWFYIVDRKIRRGARNRAMRAMTAAKNTDVDAAA